MLYYTQVEAAVAAAKEAFPAWSERSPEQRAQVLNKLADLIEAHLEEFAQAESRDQGVCLHIVSTQESFRLEVRYKSLVGLGQWLNVCFINRY